MMGIAVFQKVTLKQMRVRKKPHFGKHWKKLPLTYRSTEIFVMKYPIKWIMAIQKRSYISWRILKIKHRNGIMTLRILNTYCFLLTALFKK